MPTVNKSIERKTHRQIDVAGVALLDLADDFFGGGVDRLEGPARHRVNELPVDEEAGLDLALFDRHLGSLVG